MHSQKPRIIIVTAPQHTGKSSLLARYIGLCREQKIPIAGILAEGLWRENRRSGFDLVDLSSGIRLPLAVRSAPHGLARIGFEFFPEGIKAGKKALAKARCNAATLIVVDEVGKLEVMDKGWAPHIPDLLGLPGKTHLWAVRESLVDAVAEKWQFSPHAVVDARKPDALAELTAACGLFTP